MPKMNLGRFKRTAAKRLRVNSTNAETLLWRRLKPLDTRGTHFRRQMPIGKFIADFVCPAAYLIVEIDGSQHGEEEALAYDRERTLWLEAEGYRVVRFWNNDVTGNIDGVMEAIQAALHPSGQSQERRFKHRRSRTDS